MAPAHVSPGRFVRCRSRRTTMWKHVIVRLCLGSAVLAAATIRGPGANLLLLPCYVRFPTRHRGGATPAPGYYYVPSGYSNQTTWNGYAPQYYQVNYNSPVYQSSYTPQTYQPTYAQPTYITQATQPAATGSQYVQTSYVQQTAQPTAAPAAAVAPSATAPAATAPAATAGAAPRRPRQHRGPGG